MISNRVLASDCNACRMTFNTVIDVTFFANDSLTDA